MGLLKAAPVIAKLLELAAESAQGHAAHRGKPMPHLTAHRGGLGPLPDALRLLGEPA